MPSLTDQITALTTAVVSGSHDLDDALVTLDEWVHDHAGQLSEAERKAFSATLDQPSTNDDRSLVDSVLKLHATRLLYRYDRDRRSPPPEPESAQNEYTRSRAAFMQALSTSEEAINEARIDIAIANAHHLLGNAEANRRWLDAALDRLPPLVTTDLAALAEAIPAMPFPRLGPLKRAGLKLMGFNFERLAQDNRANLTLIARMQAAQVVILAHLIGTSFEAIRERPRANRAFRFAAHLIARHDGLHGPDADQLMGMAESLYRPEPEAACVLARQARSLYEAAQNADGLDRADAFLENQGM
jgi:hypothetical protein